MIPPSLSPRTTSTNLGQFKLKFLQSNQRKSIEVDTKTKEYTLNSNESSHTFENSLLIVLLQEPYYSKHGSLLPPDTQYKVFYLKQPGILARAATFCPSIYNPRLIPHFTDRDTAGVAITIGDLHLAVISVYLEDAPC